ncbi:MAG: permease-like cell division protein FtsX [Oscillospiraceae bacterium]
MKLSGVNYLFRQGVRNIWTNRIMSVASFCILMVSLLLVGFSTLFIVNVNSIIGGIENKNEVIIYLDDDISQEKIGAMENELRAIENISDVVFYSKDEAFAQMKSEMADSEELFQYVGEESPLPDSYRVKVENIEKMSSTLMAINSLDGIYSVKAPNDFVNVLTELKRFISLISVTVLAALVIVSLVMISNASRASVEMRKREIEIMKYVGATNAFVKTPFFVEGMVIGILAGAVSAVITLAGYSKVMEMIMSQQSLWSAIGSGGFTPTSSVAVKIVIGYIAAGAVISAVGTVMSTKKYVKV